MGMTIVKKKIKGVIFMNFRNKKIFSLFLSLALVIGVVIGSAPMAALQKKQMLNKLLSFM